MKNANFSWPSIENLLSYEKISDCLNFSSLNIYNTMTIVKMYDSTFNNKLKFYNDSRFLQKLAFRERERKKIRIRQTNIPFLYPDAIYRGPSPK